MWLPLLGLLAGIVIASLFSISVPTEYSRYSAIAILAALDSILGAARSSSRAPTTTRSSQLASYDMLLAALLTLLGDRLGVDILSMAAIVAFGVRACSRTWRLSAATCSRGAAGCARCSAESAMSSRIRDIRGLTTGHNRPWMALWYCQMTVTI